MKCKVIAFIILFISMVTVTASVSAFDNIEFDSLSLEGNCINDDIQVIKELGGAYIKAYFNDMTTTTMVTSPEIRKCIIQYNVTIPRDYRLSSLKFAMDSIYKFSIGGSAWLSIAHGVGNAAPYRSSKLYHYKRDGENGEINDYNVTIPWNKLPQEYQGCGATKIPVKTELMIVASQFTNAGPTVITLDEAVSRVKLQYCSDR
ncbi:hypothetical protein [Spartinivicinus ruber]|uniref:hypothetical protein n=1 Tax=Spartinivicinus ruber TaxID=2683272 RepID=UPI0013D6AA78|nr:hypothetical protein [Spartinivicinus ruber]